MKTAIFPTSVAAAILLAACHSPNSATKPAPPSYPTLGSIEKFDPGLDELIGPGAKMERLAEGFTWAEGPVWLRERGFLVFSDVPRNMVLKWKEGEGISEFLKPSGYTGTVTRKGEPGSNGLTLDNWGRLTLAQHGDRQIGRRETNGAMTVLTGNYIGLRYNSPNDLAYKSNGDLYFTDPPYGLEGGVNDPKKEIPFSGVYRLGRDGRVTLLVRALTFPNGLAFSPDEKRLYVAVSDQKAPNIYVFDVRPDGTLEDGRLFFNAAPLVPNHPGLPDGMKVDRRGNLFATGPGGVLVIAPSGKLLGRLNTGEPTANCAWGGDGSVLYITANHYLARIQTRTRGAVLP